MHLFLQLAIAQLSAAAAATQQQNKLNGKVNLEKYWKKLQFTKYLQQTPTNCSIEQPAQTQCKS